jgi:hypothetical protein
MKDHPSLNMIIRAVSVRQSMFRYSGRSALCAIGATRAREEGRLLFSPLFLATDMVAHTTDIGDLGIVADETSLIYI